MADRRHDIAACLLILLIPIGCAGALEHTEAPDAAEARTLLESALGAWKEGRVKSLRTRTPPVRLVDHDQAAGRGLGSYRIAGEPQAVGNTLDFPVELTLKDRRGPARIVSAVYQVVLEPAAAVFRNDP